MAAKKRPKLAASTQSVKLDLACGQNVREGFEGVDLLAPGTRKIDLLKFPWPIADSSVDELNCSHFIEHIPARDVEARDLVPLPTKEQQKLADAIAERSRFIGQDMFFAFFDECWRILKTDGWMHVVTPTARSNRGFQDPTHRRFIVAETFGYLWRDWRVANKLDHYRVRCNFISEVNSNVDAALGMRAPEVQQEMVNTRWNVVFDWVVKLQAKK